MDTPRACEELILGVDLKNHKKLILKSYETFINFFFWKYFIFVSEVINNFIKFSSK